MKKIPTIPPHPRGFWHSPTVTAAINKFIKGEATQSAVVNEIQKCADSLGSHGKKITGSMVEYYARKAGWTGF
jgi:hypothetical protein